MKPVRIIPRLDVKGPNVVKGIHLEGLRVLGKPSDFSKYYYEQGADELMFMDVVASLYDRNSLHDIVSETARNVFIPITVGGGLRTLSDIRLILRAGADKVSINTAALKNKEFIRQASNEFGSSTIVVAIEAIKQPNGEYMAFTDNGREYAGVNAVDWAVKAQEYGAGELVITSVDREGTGMGFDMELLNEIASKVSIPIIAHGGAGVAQHVIELFDGNQIDAVALSSVLHYEAIKHISNNQSRTNEGNFDFLNSGKVFSKVDTIQLYTLKEQLRKHDFDCR